jgi:hypothetical protein
MQLAHVRGVQHQPGQAVLELNDLEFSGGRRLDIARQIITLDCRKFKNLQNTNNNLSFTQRRCSPSSADLHEVVSAIAAV